MASHIRAITFAIFCFSALAGLVAGDVSSARAAQALSTTPAYGSNHAPPLPDPESQSLQPSRAPTSDPRLLLPDLLTMPPSDLKIARLPDGSRELRLSNTIWNAGPGALELEGENDRRTGQTRVVQHVHARAGARLDHQVGEFIFHPTHDHWHFDGFSVYELWTLTPLGELDSLASSSDKVSYCLIDTDIIDPDHPAYQPRRRYTGCGELLQGISTGWGDTYKSHLDGQSIHLPGVEDGFYALVSTANPDGILLEADTSNNTAVLYIEIRAESVALVTPADIADQACPALNRC